MPTEQQVKELAYHLWEQEGRPHGMHLEHYYRALTTLRQREREQEAKGRAVPSLANIGMPSAQLALPSPTEAPRHKRRGRKSAKQE
jgi:hypothetical protein